MWSAFGEELSLLLAADRLRIRRYKKWPRRLLFETETPVSDDDSEAAAQWSANIHTALSAHTRTAKAFVAENLCRVEWAPMPQQKLNAAEVEALVRSQAVRSDGSGADVHVAFDSTASPNGAVFATVDRTLLTQLTEVLKQGGVRLTSAEPALAAVVSNWLNLPDTNSAKRRHLVVLDNGPAYVFTTRDGRLASVTRLAASMHSDSFATRLASIRISMDLAAVDHDVLITPSLSGAETGIESPEIVRPAAANFTDLYKSVSGA